MLSDLVGDQKVLQATRRLRSFVVGIFFRKQVLPCGASTRVFLTTLVQPVGVLRLVPLHVALVIRHTLLLVREILHALAEQLHVLLHERRRAQIQSLVIGVVERHILVSHQLAHHRRGERAIPNRQRHLHHDIIPLQPFLMNLFHGQLSVAILIRLDKLFTQFQRLQRAHALLRVRRIVRHAHAALQALGVGQKRRDEFLVIKRPEIRALIPSNDVRIHINLSQAPHHVELIRRALLRGERAVRIVLIVRGHLGKRKARRHVEARADIQPQQLSGRAPGRGVGAMFHDLERGAAVEFDGFYRRLGLLRLLSAVGRGRLGGKAHRSCDSSSDARLQTTRASFDGDVTPALGSNYDDTDTNLQG